MYAKQNVQLSFAASLRLVAIRRFQNYMYFRQYMYSLEPGSPVGIIESVCFRNYFGA